MVNIHGLKEEAKKLRIKLKALLEQNDSTYSEIRQTQHKINAIHRQIVVLRNQRKPRKKE